MLLLLLLPLLVVLLTQPPPLLLSLVPLLGCACCLQWEWRAGSQKI